LVSTTSTSWSCASRRCTITVLRAVTDEANELTTSKMRKAREGNRSCPLVCPVADYRKPVTGG
jgi:hypothetical protein